MMKFHMTVSGTLYFGDRGDHCRGLGGLKGVKLVLP